MWGCKRVDVPLLAADQIIGEVAADLRVDAPQGRAGCPPERKPEGHEGEVPECRDAFHCGGSIEMGSAIRGLPVKLGDEDGHVGVATAQANDVVDYPSDAVAEHYRSNFFCNDSLVDRLAFAKCPGLIMGEPYFRYDVPFLIDGELVGDAVWGDGDPLKLLDPVLGERYLETMDDIIGDESSECLGTLLRGLVVSSFECSGGVVPSSLI